MYWSSLFCLLNYDAVAANARFIARLYVQNSRRDIARPTVRPPPLSSYFQIRSRGRRSDAVSRSMFVYLSTKTKPITRLSTSVFEFTRGATESHDCLCGGLNAGTDRGNSSSVYFTYLDRPQGVTASTSSESFVYSIVSSPTPALVQI